MSSLTAPGLQTQRPSHHLHLPWTYPASHHHPFAAGQKLTTASLTPRPSIAGFSQSSLPAIPRILRFPELAPVSWKDPHTLSNYSGTQLSRPMGPPPHCSLTVASGSLLSARDYKVVDVR